MKSQKKSLLEGEATDLSEESEGNSVVRKIGPTLKDEITSEALDETKSTQEEPEADVVAAPLLRRDGTPRLRPVRARSEGQNVRASARDAGAGVEREVRPTVERTVRPAMERTVRPAVERTVRPAVERTVRPAVELDIEAEDEQRERRIEKLGGRRGRKSAEASSPDAAEEFQPEVRPAVAPAKMRKRHYGVLLSFVIMVILPIAAASSYLWTRAVDQYESHIGFAVRAESQSSAPDLFGGLLGSSGGSTSEDMHILNAYILSQEIVQLIDAKLDLRRRYSGYPQDPVFTFNEKGTIEDLVAYWQRMVKVNFDGGSGLMELRVFAFTPQDAKEIAAAVLEESNNIINNLSAIARDDSTRFAREALENARIRATEARAALAQFRAKNQVADPSTEVAAQTGVLSSLQQQLAEALVELDLVLANGRDNDPRIVQLNRRIDAIQGRIDQERANMGIGGNGEGFAEVLSEYERLTVDKTFAEQAYLSALAGFDSAMATASQKSRYLASYVSPTLSEASTAPVRPLLTFVIGIIAFMIWASIILIYYALRDRR